MKLFTHKSIKIFMILILLATVLTFFQSKNVVKLDNGKTIIVDKYNSNTEVKVEKSGTLGDILELIQEICNLIIQLIFGSDNSGTTKPPSETEKHYYTYKYKDVDYYVVEGLSMNELQKSIGKQTAGKCTWWARAYAQRILTSGNTNPSFGGDVNEYGLKKDTGYQGIQSNGYCNTSGMYNEIKTQILRGHPVVIYVGFGGDDYPRNHNLTIVGIKKEVVDEGLNFGTESFLAIDPYDANLCNMQWNGGDCGFTNGRFSVRDNKGNNTSDSTTNYKCLIEYAP